MTKLDVVTGFLGAGKTTFLQAYHRWLTDTGAASCIIENEFGDAGVDGAVLRSGGAAVREISGGCWSRCRCCTPPRGRNWNLTCGSRRFSGRAP